ncbi:hypothetical protein AAMO2058_001062700 [Amorphochlora amoebiformis]
MVIMSISRMRYGLRKYYSSKLINIARFKSTSAPGSRIAKLREELDASGAGIESFIAGNPLEDSRKPKIKKPLRPKKIDRKPAWLKAEFVKGESLENYQRLKDTVKGLGLATVCEEARCPNIGECWGGKQGTATATIMLMGDTCTRACRFCAVKTSNAPPPLDPQEPQKVATAIHKWGLDYVVLTSVDRDDLKDGGASHMAECISKLKDTENPPLVECLTPDFSGNLNHVEIVAKSGLDVFAHNLETVEPLQGKVRDRRANYSQSMSVLRHVKEVVPTMITKTSLMLGCGETNDEILRTLEDLRKNEVDVVTFGQYLRPSKKHMKVADYVTPEQFQHWQDTAQDLGFLYVASGPLVRSSYKAGEFFLKNVLDERRKASASA